MLTIIINNIKIVIDAPTMYFFLTFIYKKSNYKKITTFYLQCMDSFWSFINRKFNFKYIESSLWHSRDPDFKEKL